MAKSKRPVLSQYEPPSVRATRVVEDRGSVYGPPTPIYLDLADHMNIWLRIPGVSDPEGIVRSMNALDGAVFNIFLKLCREKYMPGHADNMTDICGYANVYEMIERDM